MICASPLIQPWQHKTTAMRCNVFCGTQHTHQTETTSTQPEQATTAEKQKRAAFPLKMCDSRQACDTHDARDRHPTKEALSTNTCLHNCLHLNKYLHDAKTNVEWQKLTKGRTKKCERERAIEHLRFCFRLCFALNAKTRSPRVNHKPPATPKCVNATTNDNTNAATL